MGLSLDHSGRITEIDQFDRSVFTHHHVVGLDVPVRYPTAVEVVDRLCQSHCYLSLEGDGESMGVAAEVVLEGGCVGDELKEDVNLRKWFNYLSFVLEAVSDADDGGMLQFAEYFDLPQDPLFLGGLNQLVLFVYLHCELPAALLLPPQAHTRVGSASQHILQLNHSRL